MAKFEVHIPPGQDGGFNVTLKIDADNWMAALKTGMTKLGEQGSSVQNVLVDIQDDNSIHVTESRSGRVFRIRELSEEEAAAAQVKKVPAKRPEATQVIENPLPPEEEPHAPRARPVEAAPAPAPEKRPEAKTQPSMPAVQAEPPKAAAAPKLPKEPPPELVKTQPGFDPALVEATKPPPPEPTTKALRPSRAEAMAVPMQPRMGSSPRIPALEPKQVVELEQPTQPVVGAIGRKPPKKEEKEKIEDVLAEVFERVQDIYSQSTEEAAMYFLLDLALEKIPSESGSVYRADAGMGDLSFAAVRGPKAADLLREKIVVPAGTGIVGFCATEGVSVAVSDVEKDPRFYKTISEKLKYSTKSVLCAPMMTHGRTFGCLQLLNKSGNAHFGEHEVGLLSYIAHQAALFLNVRI
jgi:putative methionine-R-sulfoxide reductase with GAF domain